MSVAFGGMVAPRSDSIANAFLRGVTLIGPIALPQLGDPEWRRPLTHWHGIPAQILMAVALCHAAAGPIHHYL